MKLILTYTLCFFLLSCQEEERNFNCPSINNQEQKRRLTLIDNFLALYPDFKSYNGEDTSGKTYISLNSKGGQYFFSFAFGCGDYLPKYWDLMAKN
jgi:hypothetical protein